MKDSNLIKYISGLHVGMIALLITFLLKAFRVSRIYWILFLGPLLIAYTLATGARASAVRACIMASNTAAGLPLRVTTTGPSLLELKYALKCAFTSAKAKE